LPTYEQVNHPICANPVFDVLNSDFTSLTAVEIQFNQALNELSV